MFDRCSSPFLGYKTPHAARHGVTPDISNLIGWECWDKVYFKVDEKAPKSQEAPGYWMGPCPEVGDIMTHWIWSAKTGKAVQRSVIRHANPNKGGIPNMRLKFHEDTEDETEPEIVDPENHLDDPELLYPPDLVPKPAAKTRQRTNKHKVRFHDTVEASDEVMQNTDPLKDFEDANEEDSGETQDSGELPDENAKDDFGPTIQVDDLSQSHKERRKKLRRSCKAHLLTAATCLSVAAAHSTHVNNNAGLATDHKWNTFCDPFKPDSVEHILETDFDTSKSDLNHEAFVRKMQMQYFDCMDDALDTDQSHVPSQVIAHKVSTTPRRKVKDGKLTVPTD